MKLLFFLALLLSSSLMACPDFSGVYLCPKEAEDHFYFGSRKVKLHFDSNRNTYLLGLGEAQTTYYVDTWQPLPGTSTYLKAQCSNQSVVLLERFDAQTFLHNKEDNNVATSLEITASEKGLRFKRVYNDVTVFELDCDKI